MNVQIVSDLHLEFIRDKTKFNLVKPAAKILALTGDICCCVSADDFATFQRFINEILPLYELIIFVPGNHEFYYAASKKEPAGPECTIKAVIKKVRAWFAQTSPKLKLLSNDYIEVAYRRTTYCIIGSTLWSAIPPEKYKAIESRMNDYSYVYAAPSTHITPADVAGMHRTAVSYIRRIATAAVAKKQRVIVLTHHKPYLSPPAATDAVTCAYESDCTGLFPLVDLWGYGHTHIADNKKIGRCMVYSNPKGYPGQRTYYNPSESVTV